MATRIDFASGGLQSFDPLQDFKKKKKMTSGGNQKAPKPPQEPSKPKELAPFTDVKTGRPSGISVPGAGTFLGLQPSDVQTIVEQETAKATQPGGAGAIAEAQALRAQKAGAGQFLDEKGFFQQGLPTNQDLDILQRQGFEGLPVIGPGTAAISTIIADLLGKDNLSPDRAPLLQDPQTQREIALQEIQKEVIAEGTTASEKFGAVIEAIPVVGTLVSKYASGLVEDPKGNVDTLLTEIQSERERASVLAEKAATGKLGDPRIAVEQIEDIEKNIFRLEQRIKLLSIESAQLRANADQLNRIEEVILRTKERVFISKQAAAAGLVAPASDSNIFLTLEELRK